MYYFQWIWLNLVSANSSTWPNVMHIYVWIYRFRNALNQMYTNLLKKNHTRKIQSSTWVFQHLNSPLTFSVLMRRTNSGACPSGVMTALSFVLTTFSDPEKFKIFSAWYFSIKFQLIFHKFIHLVDVLFAGGGLNVRRKLSVSVWIKPRAHLRPSEYRYLCNSPVKCNNLLHVLQVILSLVFRTKLENYESLFE